MRCSWPYRFLVAGCMETFSRNHCEINGMLLLHCSCCIALHVMSLHRCIMRREHGLQQATAPFDIADSGRPGTPIGPDLVGGHYISY